MTVPVWLLNYGLSPVISIPSSFSSKNEATIAPLGFTVCHPVVDSNHRDHLINEIENFSFIRVHVPAFLRCDEEEDKDYTLYKNDEGIS